MAAVAPPEAGGENSISTAPIVVGAQTSAMVKEVRLAEPLQVIFRFLVQPPVEGLGGVHTVDIVQVGTIWGCPVDVMVTVDGINKRFQELPSGLLSCGSRCPVPCFTNSVSTIHAVGEFINGFSMGWRCRGRLG